MLLTYNGFGDQAQWRRFVQHVRANQKQWRVDQGEGGRVRGSSTLNHIKNHIQNFAVGVLEFIPFRQKQI